MVVVELLVTGQERRTLVLDLSEITIGSSPANQIVVSGPEVELRHARLVIKDGRMILVDLKSESGTYVDGRAITSPIVIHEQSEVRIGGLTLRFQLDDGFEVATVEVDVTELRLLAAIAQQEPGSRAVYADWLEEHGDPVRAEFLRLGDQIPTLTNSSELRARTSRLRELSEEVSLDWRKKVARPLIENCLGQELRCPKEWGSLATTERSDVRYCGTCTKRVYYVTTLTDARAHARAGACIAIDIGQARRPGDLEPEPSRPAPMMTMGVAVPFDDD